MGVSEECVIFLHAYINGDLQRLKRGRCHMGPNSAVDTTLLDLDTIFLMLKA